MSEEVIRVEAVSKKFCCAPRRAVLYAAGDISRSFVGLPTPTGALRTGEFWAVRDVSFSLRRGESLAIIGANGSGKSTMLNLLNRVLMPDSGTIDARGRVGALAAIGAGFNPQLTGRENITVNGLMLGMSLREIRDLSDAIIDFSEIGDFIDVPVHQYSSGMYVRLGFAIAVHAPVEIVLIDEVLAVGDLAFAIKCLRKIVEFRDQGGAVVLVTHALHHVRYVCNRALWLEKGQVRRLGSAADVAEEYEQHMFAKSNEEGQVLSYDQRVTVLKFDHPGRLASGSRLVIDVDLNFASPVRNPIFLLHMHSKIDDTLVFSHYSSLEGCHWDTLEGRLALRMTTSPLSLQRGRYRLSFSVSEGEVNRHLVWHDKKYVLEVDNPRDIHGAIDAAVTFEVMPHRENPEQTS